MAGVVDRLRRKNSREPPTARDWASTGSFINKPPRGWLHPDEQLAPDAGVCYGVRYIGCMEVKQSMKTLDFDTRTAVAKESISRVCEAAGLKSITKKTKKNAKIGKLLGDQPNLVFAGSNVNLTVTTESLTLMVMESGEVIANHQMPGISFASGGDPDTMDFVAYVAKDSVNGRACFVLECGGGLTQDVITTIGQAFELRFKQYLANQPQAVNLPDSMLGATGGDTWGEELDYYNDRPGVQPPSPVPGALPPEYSAPKCNLPVSDGVYHSVKEHPPHTEPAVGNLIDLSDDAPNDYDNRPERANNVYDNYPKTEPFDAALTAKPPTVTDQSKNKGNITPYHEEWFHGPLSRVQTEDLLAEEGDFLVRESANSPGQFVLSGMHKGRIRHLLLVDPNGVVRTRDRTFTSVSHLINYHMENGLPIVSQESELILKRPIIHSPC